MARIRAAAAAPRARVRGAAGHGPPGRVLPEPGGDGAPRRRGPAARAADRALGVSTADAQSLRARAGLGVTVTGSHLLLVPRILLCIASFAIDRILYLAAVKLHLTREPMDVVLGFASAWPTLVLLTRPFSNTCETIALALCFAVLLLSDPHQRVLFGVFHRQTLLLGSLLAFGVFTRFTFVFFFFPLGIELVRQQDALLCERLAKKHEQKRMPMHLRLCMALSIAVQGFLAFVAWSGGIILLDTAYFRPETDWKQLDRVGLLETIVVAPLNNFIYNLQYDNLQLHGVHPRLTHAGVNMPMLFGPLYVGFIVLLVSKLKSLACSDSAAKPKPAATQRGHQLFGIVAVLFPLACISMAPHQEPRFLLPLLVPLHMFFASSLSLWTHRARAAVWIVFNAALVVFFGVLHQGGVVPMLLWFSSNGQSAQSSLLSAPLSALSACQFATPDAARVQALMGAVPLVFYKTYMPPRFLLASIGARPTFEVIDLAGGGSSDSAIEILFTRQLSAAESHAFFLVAPASVDIAPLVATTFVRASALAGRCGPHLSTENFALDAPLALHLHLLTLTDAAERA